MLVLSTTKSRSTSCNKLFSLYISDKFSGLLFVLPNSIDVSSLDIWICELLLTLISTESNNPSWEAEHD